MPAQTESLHLQFWEISSVLKLKKKKKNLGIPSFMSLGLKVQQMKQIYPPYAFLNLNYHLQNSG